MKSILMPKIWAVIALLFVGTINNCYAQPLPMCWPKRIVQYKYINTGFNYNTGTLVSDGANDPKWKISNFTSLYMCCFEPPASPSFPATGNPAVVLDLVANNLYNPPFSIHYAPNTATSKWINHSNSSGDWLHFVDQDNPDCYYSTTFFRDFEVCGSTETLDYYFVINRDNWIRSVKIAGQVVYNDEASYSITHPCHDPYNPSMAKQNPPCRDAIFYNGSQPLTVSGTVSVSLSPNTLYSIEVEVGNASSVHQTDDNPVSLQLDGYIHSNNYIIED